MRKYLLSIAVFILALTTLSSCLGDSTEYTYYDDTAITAFSLGTLKNYVHTTSSKTGNDTIIKTTVSCSGYAFYIDQTSGKIWNEDSLPIGTDISKTICTITAKNSGSICLLNIAGDSIISYSSTDSIDFSSPRTIRVFNNSASAFKDYVVTINVHTEKADSCTWENLIESNNSFAALTNMRGFNLDNNICVFGNCNGEVKLYTTAINDGRNWNEHSEPLSTEASKNIILKSGKFYTLSNGELLTSVDGTNWNKVCDADFKSLIAASTMNLYAISSDGSKILCSADDGLNWTEETLDDDIAQFPTEDLSYICHTLSTNSNMEKIVVIGNRDNENDNTARVWTKIVDPTSNTNWSYTEFSDENKNMAPRAKNWQIVNYDENNIKAVTYKTDADSDSPLRNYHSGDDGITWIEDTLMSLPSGITSNEEFTYFRDNAGYLWLVCGQSGQVWKGRINRLAWKKEQDFFE